MHPFRSTASISPRLSIVGAAFGLLAIASGDCRADELRLDARRLAETAICRGLTIADDSTALILDRGELFEDDGPAAGFSYQPNDEPLSAGVRLRKTLVIDDPRAAKAFLLVGPGGSLQAEINGRVVPLAEPKKTGNYWQEYEIPVDALRAGDNAIVLWGTGKVWIARDDEFAAGAPEGHSPPNRSARSGDDGKTWSEDRLGPRGTIDGEYCVRVFLDRHVATGSATLPVVDLGNLSGAPIAPPLELPVVVRVAARVAGRDDPPDATRVLLRMRSGATPVPDERHWSDWETLTDGQPFRTEAGRFAQIRVALSTRDPLRSPQLKEVVLTAEPSRAGEWHRRLKVETFDNPTIVRTAIPFKYEPFDHPKLKRLRIEQRLDEVVAGAETELETIRRLAAWASQRWEQGHLGKVYPAWDSLDILAPWTDGTPTGGFCQQYNLVFLQACESFGIPGRAVSIGAGDSGVPIRSGHEVVELWSNEFARWIYVDGNAAWYVVDGKTRVPLSLRELRERQLAAVRGDSHPPVEAIVLAKTRYEWKGLAEWPAYCELRMIPRSNFLEQKSPLPLNQGMRGWFWTGHYAWTDAAAPASRLYGHRVSLPAQWDWTLNQAQARLEATATTNELKVHLDTQTPGLDAFVARIDDGPPQPVRTGFAWTLHPGRNRLTVRPRNIAGREGISAQIALDVP